MTVTYQPYMFSETNEYVEQTYPADFPVAELRGTKMSLVLNNITEYTDETKKRGTFEFAGVFQDAPLFFMRQNKTASMNFKIVTNQFSIAPLFFQYCNPWGKITMVDDVYFDGTALVTDTNTWQVTLESQVKKTPAVYGRAKYDIDLKFTKVQF